MRAKQNDACDEPTDNVKHQVFHGVVQARLSFRQRVPCDYGAVQHPFKHFPSESQKRRAGQNEHERGSPVTGCLVVFCVRKIRPPARDGAAEKMQRKVNNPKVWVVVEVERDSHRVYGKKERECELPAIRGARRFNKNRAAQFEGIGAGDDSEYRERVSRVADV